MKARLPDREGFVERDGVKTAYYSYGAGEPAVVLLPTWSIVHAEHWKAQVPYLSRHFHVVTMDGRGNGRSSRPKGGGAYTDHEYVADIVAVMDRLDVRQAVIVGLSYGGQLAGMLASLHPERVLGAILIGPNINFGPQHPARDFTRINTELERYEGWDKLNFQYWRRNYPDFVDFFMHQIFTEPHSTKQTEDMIGYGLETTGEVLTDTLLGRAFTKDNREDAFKRIQCPVLVIQGDNDQVTPYGKGVAAAEITGGALVTIAGGGHAPQARDPVLVNRQIKEFVDRIAPPKAARSTWTRPPLRDKRVLYLSSPIGLGHARRDLAVAQALRERVPGLKIDWLTQHPVTPLLEREGESVHAASRALVNESAHLESECGEHDLHCFQALRRMDEILVNNFMVFQEVVEQARYDLVIADEAWDVDHFWHEHPELKRCALAWFTDFVGYLPFSAGGEHEAFLTSDYNAEMIEHIERFPWVRDRALFVGNPEDVVPGAFGPGLPDIRAWTSKHFDFTGYVTGYDPLEWGDPAALRQRLGYRPDERVCIATVGGSGVGTALLRRILDAWPAVRRRLPELRMVVVAGPRIDPALLAAPPGVEVRGYVPDLNQHLTVCDIALVQGGLTTCMELAAAKRPFLYFPLRNHFEQCFHVAHRLGRYRAGRRMDFEHADPDAIAAAMVDALARPVDTLPVETGGAQRAAGLLAEML